MTSCPFRRLRRVAAAFAALFVAAACAVVDPTPPEPLSVLDNRSESFFGRAFQLTTLRSEVGGQRFDTLQIAGDQVVVSFATSTPPFTPDVNGATISFGGHRFEVTSVPNRYRVDGTIADLPANAIYIFNDGVLRGRLL